MKIKSIRISNILSFEHKDNIDDCQQITFSKNLNVLIGPNGAGKSNFLEIINQIFRNALFYDCTFNENTISSYKNNPTQTQLTNTLRHRPRNYNLIKNKDSSTESKRITLEIELNENDKTNLIFIQKNVTKINKLFLKYVNTQNQFPTTITEDDLKSVNTVTYTFEDVNNQKSLTNVTNPSNEPSRFIFLYLQLFNFLQNLIMIARKEESEDWSPLRNTFALISGYRNYNQIQSDSTIQVNESDALQGIKDRMLADTTRSSSADEPVVFSYVKHKLAYEYHKLRGEIGTPTGKDPIDLFSDPIFTNINKILHVTLGLRLYIEKQHPNNLVYLFSFIDEKTHKPVQIFDLSAGEKSIIHFIFSIYGYDLENGVLIIDEPELHLHPQIQQKYLNILFEVMSQMGLQFIIATHSPVFVNSKTIEGVQRFYKKDDKFTKVANPTITSSEKDLVQILTYTNSAKIFFSDKVVLVEGDSDEYFFRFFLDQYKKSKMKTDTDIEFLYIGGKGRFWFWKDFLTKYEIKTYYIGDLDNVLDDGFSIMDKTMIETLQKEFESQPDTIQCMRDIPKYEKGSKCYNRDFLKYVKTKSEWSSIKSKIEGQYTDKIYILQEGELENYLDSHSKLEGVIDFCKNKFDAWYTDVANKTKIDELNKIFDQIVA